jgi:uncharacterized membrane protein YebE (DUF533 family)
MALIDAAELIPAIASLTCGEVTVANEKDIAMIDMNRLLTQVMGATPGQTASAPDVSGMPRDLRSLAGQVMSQMAPGHSGSGIGYAGALGSGALAGGLAGLLFGSKKMREVAGTAIQIGAVAAIGGLAYKAYQNYRQGKPIVPQSVTDMIGGASPQSMPLPAPADTIPEEYRSPEAARLLLRTMVAAAAADGHLDRVEYERIRQQLRASGLNEEEQFFLSQLIAHPSSIAELAAAATTPELRVEVYTAARLAVDRDTAVERDWLEQLAVALDLEPGLKAHLDAIESQPRMRAA